MMNDEVRMTNDEREGRDSPFVIRHLLTAMTVGLVLVSSLHAEEQADGLEMMVEGLETCSARNADLKRLVRELRDAVG